MTREELIKNVNEYIGYNIMTDKDIEACREKVTCDGKTYDVYLCGNDEMFELDEFFQIGIDPINDKFYKFYYNAEETLLDDIDYSKAYRMEEIEDIDEWI